MLTIYQEDVSIGVPYDGVIVSCGYDLSGNIIVVTQDTIALGVRNSSNNINGDFTTKTADLQINELVLDAIQNGDGSWLFIIGNTSQMLYMLTKTISNYTMQSKIDLGVPPTSLWISLDDFRETREDRLFVGLSNGSINIFCYNNNSYSSCQLINTTHSTIKKISASPVKMVVCGANDSFVSIFILNSTTLQYQLFQRVFNISGNCTSLYFPANSARIAIGRSDGSVYIIKEYQQSPDLIYKVANIIQNAHQGSVIFVVFTSDGISLLTAGTDNMTNLWVELNDFQVSKSY